MLQRDGVVMVEMKVLVMEMMMIPMKSGAMAMTTATISPLREGISLADSCLPESFSLSSVFCPAEVAVSLSEPPLSLRFSGTMIYAKGRWQKWARVASPQAGAARGGPTPPGGKPTLWLLSLPPSGFFNLLAKYNFVVFFWNFLIFQKWCLDGPFSSRILTPAANLPMIIEHVKTEEPT
jgi:hypothetical protein